MCMQQLAFLWMTHARPTTRKTFRAGGKTAALQTCREHKTKRRRKNLTRPFKLFLWLGFIKKLFLGP